MINRSYIKFNSRLISRQFMVTESDFIAALQAYQDTLANPGTKIEDVRPHIENHLNELIGHLPSIAQSIAKERAYVELDKIELIAKLVS